LYLTHAEVRRRYGQETYPRPSRFVSEITAELLNEGAGDSARVQVNFSNAGTKWLVVSFANLQAV
jgi:DNA helicase-2/ATP-dependent DNA helicase PcrA